MVGQKTQLGIARLTGQILGLFDKTSQHSGFARGRRFQVVVGKRVGSAVENAGFQLVFAAFVRGASTCAQRLRRRRRTGGHTPHQGKGAPKAETLSAFISASGLNYRGAVVQHVLEKYVPRPGQAVGQLLGFPPRE